jgi:hypothetical protein
MSREDHEVFGFVNVNADVQLLVKRSRRKDGINCLKAGVHIALGHWVAKAPGFCISVSMTELSDHRQSSLT